MAGTNNDTKAPEIPQGAKMYNVARSGMSENSRKILPRATKTNIGQIQDVLFNDAYQPMLNEFVTNLINRIALTIVRNKSFSNPLNMFKKGSVPLGTDIQDLYTNPAEAEPYEYSNEAMAKLLTITDPDTHVAYYRRNRKDKYTKTIAREGLQGAFTSWDKFTDFVTSITTSLYSGNYIDEFEYTKDLIDGAYENNKVIMVKVDKVIDEKTAKAFVKKARAIYKKMSLPSTKYNAYSKFSGAKGVIKTWTEPERICMIMGADVSTEVDVEVLASAFNIKYADFLGRVIDLDEFRNPEIQGVLFDESWLQIYDNLFRFDEFYNANVMAWNEYLHVWSTFAICPFANAIAFVTDLPIVNLEDGSSYDCGPSITLTEGETKVVKLITNPANAGPIQFDSTNHSFAKVEKIDDRTALITGVATGSATIKAKVTGGNETTVDLSVTVSA